MNQKNKYKIQKNWFYIILFCLFLDQISKILAYMEQLNEVDTSRVEEFSGDILNNQQNLRDDVISKSLDREEIIKLAPESDGVYFKVPKVIKKEEE